MTLPSFSQLVVIAALCGLVLPLAAQESAAFDRSLGPLIEGHCVSCHGGDHPKAGLDLMGLDHAAASRADLVKLLGVRDRLVAGDMPPPGRPRPAATAVADSVAWANKTLATRAIRLPSIAGRTTVRRLSRTEYARTVRHLFGVDADAVAATFPADDLGYGFDNIGEALTFSTLHIEKFAAAAEDIAARTVNTEDPSKPVTRTVTADDMSSTLGDRSARGDVHSLFTNGRVTGRFELPRKGTYRVRVTMWAQQAGDELARARISIGGKRRKTVDVKARDRRRGRMAFEVELEGGRQPVDVAFINDYYNPDHPDRSRRDRNLIVHLIEVIGPIDPPRLTDGHRWLFAADLGKGATAKRARPVVRALLARVWRRPPTAAEVSRFAKLVDAKVATGASFHEGVRLAVAGALVSPHFLFRVEPGGKSVAGGADHALDDWSLGTRLSYFLWSSTPDEALLRAASRQDLSDRGGLLREAGRMLRDDRASALATQFASQWLEVKNLVDASPDPQRFPTFDEALRDGFRRETELFFEHLLRQGRPVRELIGANYSFLNERLARHYGVEGVEGRGFRKVDFADGSRGGVLSHGSVHLVTSDPTRTSPVKRGKWILENLLGTPPPPPPPGVDALEEAEIQSAASLRQQMALHRSNATCASCHVRMDALGFALEGFDPLGRARRGDGGDPIDTRGTLPGGRVLNGVADLRRYIRDDPLFVRTVARKLFVYAVGRDVSDADALAIEVMAAGLPPDPTLEDLILGIIQLDAFRRRSVAR